MYVYPSACEFSPVTSSLCSAPSSSSSAPMNSCVLGSGDCEGVPVGGCVGVRVGGGGGGEGESEKE